MSEFVVAPIGSRRCHSMSKHGISKYRMLKQRTSHDRGSAGGDTDGRVIRRRALGAISVSGLDLALAATATDPAASAPQVTQSRPKRGIVGQLATPLDSTFGSTKMASLLSLT